MADPAITDEALATGVKWVVGTIISLVTVIGTFLGVNKLAENRQKRRYDQKDKHDAISDANQGKSIDADQEALKIVTKRLETVETRLFKLEDLLRTQMEKNAGLVADNKHLQTEIDGLRQENKDLREHRRESDKLIAALQQELALLKQRFDKGTPLPVQIVDGESS